MSTSEVKYLGNLRTEALHLKSGEKIITDAPIDNKGKGEAFSPTDLLATSLGNCMLTVMGIAANEHGINMDGTSCSVSKIMAVNPRRVAEIQITFTFPVENNYIDKEKKILEKAALTCPVYYSLHPDVIKTVSFNY